MFDLKLGSSHPWNIEKKRRERKKGRVEFRTITRLFNKKHRKKVNVLCCSCWLCVEREKEREREENHAFVVVRRDVCSCYLEY